MKRVLFVLLGCLAMAGSFARKGAGGDANAQTRTVGSFHAIKISDEIEVVMKQGTEESVTVTAATKEYADSIETEVVNGVLNIYYDGAVLTKRDIRKRKIKANVTFKWLDRVTASSNAVAKVDGRISSYTLNIDLSSGAVFKAEVYATNLTIKVDSGTMAQVTGQARTANLKSADAGKIFASTLFADYCYADAFKRGLIEIAVKSNLVANARKGGDIFFKALGAIHTQIYNDFESRVWQR